MRINNSARSAGKPWLRVNNEADKAAEIYICGPIGGSYWDDSGMTEKEFRDAIKDIPAAKPITVHINSEGGSVSDGIGIYNALRSRGEAVTTVVDGYAVSIASIIALAGHKVISPKSSIWMIHEPWTMCQGDSEEMLRAAEMLDKHGDMLAAIYGDRTDKTKAEARELMKSETWMTGEEAVANGFADEMPEEVAPQALAALDVSKFKNVPPHIAKLLNAGSHAAPNQTTAKLDAGTTPEPTTGQADAGNANQQTASPLQISAAGGNHQHPGDTMPANKRNKMPTEIPVADNSAAALDELKKQLQTEKRARIAQRVDSYVQAQRITVEQADLYVEAAMNDEAKAFKALDSTPIPAGPASLGPVTVLTDGPVDQIAAQHKTPQARFSAMSASFPRIWDECSRRDAHRGNTWNSNSYSATLVTTFLADGFITKLQNRWAALKAFSRDFSTDPYKPLASGAIKFTTAGSSTLTDATNFEQGNSTVDVVSVTMHQYSQPFQVSNSDLNSGLRMENLIDVNVAALADKVIAIATAPITVANFTATPLVKPAGSFGFEDLKTLWGQLKKSPIKNLLLDGEYLAMILNNPALFQAAGSDQGGGWARFGWDGIYLNTNWTGAGANMVGFACNPQANAVVAGLPLTPPNIPGATLMQSSFTVPDVNISVANYSWFSLQSRTGWVSYDLMLGAAKADATAGICITSQ